MIRIDQNTLKTETWADLQTYLFDIHESSTDRYRSEFAYRGVSNAKHGLQTSLQRIGRIPSEVEYNLIRNFQKYSPINTLIDNYDNIWNWISLGQHHGLPTRLLDWTFSPNVALHFMTDHISTFNEDGAIWMVNFIELRNHLPKELQTRASGKKRLTFSSKELQEFIGSSIEEINDFKIDYGNGLVFFEPPSIDDRIVNQFALFSFMLDPDTDKLLWLNEHPTLFKKILIPHTLKWEIRDKLDQANITERVIYPGLDGISRWLARWYSERNEKKQWKLP